MNNKKLNNNIFKTFILIELGTAILFILYVYLPVMSQVSSSGNSNITVVSVDAIEKVHKTLDSRKQLTYPDKFDLSKFDFGKEEPFQ